MLICVVCDIFQLPRFIHHAWSSIGCSGVSRRRLLTCPPCPLGPPSLPCRTGKELATGREIAIKKIKVGQFKDGLDMSAIREIKFLREIRHENVIEVRPHIASLGKHKHQTCSLPITNPTALT